MFTRLLTIQNQSFFLLGPRGTGKSTWLKSQLPEALYIDLLQTEKSLVYSKNSSQFYREVQSSPQTWVIVDEVQKVPALLDEVHRLIEEKKYRFVLCGSSARKLKKEGANLLAGRALMVHLFPLVSKELGASFKLPEVFSTGTLPMAITGADPKAYLKTYAEVYLNEEIKAEALTRNIGGFARFLEIAARQNAQITNVSNIARDALVARQTVQGYFDILVDTLIGFWLPAWKLKRATKQKNHPKFYFFDPGVVRALSGRVDYPPSSQELGFLMETVLLHELRAYLSYNQKQYSLYYWSSESGLEVDVIFETQDGYLAIEIKSSDQWHSHFNKGLSRIQNELGRGRVKCLGVYLGDKALSFDGIQVLPVTDFLNLLWDSRLFQ